MYSESNYNVTSGMKSMLNSCGNIAASKQVATAGARIGQQPSHIHKSYYFPMHIIFMSVFEGIADS